MKCPVDNTDLKSLSAHDIEVDICLVCGGIWLGKKYFEKATQYFSDGGSYHEIAYTKVPNIESDHLQGKKCPEDGHVMKRHTYGGNSPVCIDHCELCRGYWCDSGELLEIQKVLQPSQHLAVLEKYFVKDMVDSEKRKRELEALPAKLLYHAAFLIKSPMYLVYLLVSYVTKRLIKEAEKR